MSYDYEKTSISLYRALFQDNYDVDVSCYLKPDKELVNASEIAPILHPTFDAIIRGSSRPRPPDIQPNEQTGMYDPDTGGTSVFDRPNVLRKAKCDFLIPDGTNIPPDLKVRKDNYNDRLGAIHYTITPSKPMFREVLMGQLDNFVRNAIRRQWEKARGL